MCTCPNYMLFDGRYNFDSGKEKLIFMPHSSYDKVLASGVPFIQVPCGKCLECRIQATRSWADRCCLEAKNSPFNYFITLTYNDDNLPVNNSLLEYDMQCFFKRLRKRFKGVKFKYFYVGEYGDTTLRPHYHCLLFGLPLDDLSHEFITYDGREYCKGKLINDGIKNVYLLDKNPDLFYSDIIASAWHYLGQISVGKFNYDTAAYCAQYCTKKINGKLKEFYKKFNVVPEFIRMSKGLGKSSYNDDLYDNGSIIIPSSGEAHVSAIPRYFDKLFIKKYGEEAFNDTIRQYRLKNKFISINNYIHDCSDFDKDNEIRDYTLNKRQSIKTIL